MIEIHNLNAGYGSKIVLRDVTMNFSGGAAGLLGPNGAGKSTLLKTLLGFIPPLSGTVQVMGQPLPEAAMAVRSRVGYMPEMESFIPGINAVQFVAYMAELSGLPRSAAMERSHEVLQYVGLGESRYRNLETYSMGMKQRAKLAQAIVHDPALLLLDEPTNGMDPQGRAEMLELVQDLARNKGMSVILCSHLLQDVETIANEIIVMGNGQVISKQVQNRAVQSAQETRIFSVRVRGDRQVFMAGLAQQGYETMDRIDEAAILVGISDGDEGGTAKLYQVAADAGCVIQRLEQRRERLEDVFVKAVGELGNAHL